MSSVPMKDVHDPADPWAWRLVPGRARRLRAEPRLRWLAVQRGRVWLTCSEATADRSQDIWLHPGEGLALPAGSEWVAEGWPEAEVLLLQAPGVCG
jgi:hypothetical protein